MISNTRYAVRDGNGGEQGAISESIISYTFNAIRDRCIFAASNKGVSRCFNYRITIITAIISGVTIFHDKGSEFVAITENSLSNSIHTIAYSDGGEGETTPENVIINARYAVWDGDGGEGATTFKSAPSNTRDAVWDYCIFAASNKGVTCCFYYRIAILAAIVCNITTFDYHGGERGAFMESIINAHNTIGDGDRGEGAIIESPPSNTRDAVRDGDESEGGAVIESHISNARNWTIKSDSTYSVFIGIADDFCAESIGGTRCNDIAISRGVGNGVFLFTLFYKFTHILCPTRCLICLQCAARNIADRSFFKYIIT